MPRFLFGILRSRDLLVLEKRNEKFFQMSLLCLGFSQMVGLFLYAILYFCSMKMTPSYENEEYIIAFQVLLASAMFSSVVYGCVLVAAARRKNTTLVIFSVSLCVCLALIDLILGVMGIAVFSTRDIYTIKFVLLLVYLFILIDMLWSICFDLPLILIYKQLLNMDTPAGSPSPSSIAHSVKSESSPQTTPKNQTKPHVKLEETEDKSI